MPGPVLNQNAVVFRGNSASLVVALTQADGTPYDPTLDVEIRYRAARSRYADESECVIRKESGAGVSDLGGGSISVDLEPSDSDIDPGVYYHELRIWDGTDVATALIGALIVKPALKMTSTQALSPSAAVIQLSGQVPTRT